MQQNTIDATKYQSKDFNFDTAQEKVIIKCLDQTLFRNYLNEHFKIKHKILDFSNAPQEQFDGCDIVVEQPNKTAYVDIKAQTNNYINHPTPTFCLELGCANPTFTRPGWWLNKKLSTTHYIFMWIDRCNVKNIAYTNYAGRKKHRQVIDNENDILEYRVMIINRQKAHSWLTKQGCTDEMCWKAFNLLKNDANIPKYKDKTKDIARIYFDMREQKITATKPSHGEFLTFTRTLWGAKEEQPINLVISNKYWSKIANKKYKVLTDAG